MVDTVSKQRRSEIMSAVRSKNTRPEMVVRSFLHKKGLRFRLHPSKMPGKPDLVFTKYKTVVFIHGCFWHAHQNCPGNRIPKSNVKFWEDKILGNSRRDAENASKLLANNWRVLVIWECQINKLELLDLLADTISNINSDVGLFSPSAVHTTNHIC